MGTNFFKDVNTIAITGGNFNMMQSPVHNNTDSRRQTIHHAPVYVNDNREQTIYRAPVHKTNNSGQTIYNAPVHEIDNSGQTIYHQPVRRTDNRGQKIYHKDVYEYDNRDQNIYRGEVRYNNNGGQNIHHGSVSDDYFQPAVNPETTRNPHSGERDGQRDRNTGLQAPYLSRENDYRTPPPHGPYPVKSHTVPNPRGQPYLSPPLTPYNSATNEARERGTGGNYSRVKQAVSPLGVPSARQNTEEPANFFAPDGQIYGEEEVNSPDSDGDVPTEDMARLGIDESKSKKKKPAAAENTPYSRYPHAWNNPESQDTSYPMRSNNPFLNPYPSPESSSRDTGGPSFGLRSPVNTMNMNSNNTNYTTIQGSYNDSSITTTKISKAGGKKRKD